MNHVLLTWRHAKIPEKIEFKKITLLNKRKTTSADAVRKVSKFNILLYPETENFT